MPTKPPPPPAEGEKDDKRKEAARADCVMCGRGTGPTERWLEGECEACRAGSCFLVLVVIYVKLWLEATELASSSARFPYYYTSAT